MRSHDRNNNNHNNNYHNKASVRIRDNDFKGQAKHSDDNDRKGNGEAHICAHNNNDYNDHNNNDDYYNSPSPYASQA